MSILAKGGHGDAHAHQPQGGSPVPSQLTLVTSALGFVDRNGDGIDDRGQRGSGKGEEQLGPKASGETREDRSVVEPGHTNPYQLDQNAPLPGGARIPAAERIEFELPPEAPINYPIGQQMRDRLDAATAAWCAPYDELMAA